ncbi:MAG: molybdopterin molybdotransferase MoeA [Euryarchaeota archaeon]|nr:molybdopterin molybdotransferase MoeA [Euryarchaeota archaeon]
MVFKKRTRVDLAKKTLLEHITPIKRRERIPIKDAAGRVLAENIISAIDVPDHRRAAMDGYAVRAEETTGASPANPVLLREGTDCVRVHTGSPVPDEVDAVVMIEDTIPSESGGMVEIRSAVHPNKHVSMVGEDVCHGDTIFGSGHHLRGCDIAMLGMIGISHVQVYAHPRVAIIPTGSELVPMQSEPESETNKIRETNGIMVGLYVEKWGGIPVYKDIVIDDPDLIEKAIRASADCDAIILCGGTSVGARDYVPGAIESLGSLLVHGVGLSPGKPAALGMIDTTGKTVNETGTIPVLSLPGYPVACLIALFEFGRPAICELARMPLMPDRLMRVRLGAKIASKIGYLTYTRVRVTDGVAHPVMTSGAGILSSVTGSNGFVVIRESLEGLDEGDEVDVIWIE